MNETFRIEIDEADLALAFERAPELLQAQLYRDTMEASLLLEREIKERTPVGAYSALRSSISAREPEVSGGEIAGAVGTPLAYAVPVELGTKPHFPPIEPLEDWVQAKLNVSPERASAVAWLVARKIAARGTEGTFMFAHGFAAVEGQVHDIYRRGAELIVAEIGGGS
jgi:hypothetical protein